MKQLSAADGVNCEVPMIVPTDVNDDAIQVGYSSHLIQVCLYRYGCAYCRFRCFAVLLSLSYEHFHHVI